MDYTTEYYDMVRQIAAEYRNKYPMVERDDIEQELWVWFAEHPRKLAAWSAEHNQKSLDKLIAKSLRNAAYDYCLKEKARLGGGSYDDYFWYSKEFIKILLPGVLMDNWQRLTAAMSNSGRSTKSPSEAGDWMAYRADIKAAFEKLSEQEQNLVFLYYAQDIDSNELHEQADDQRTTPAATAMAANRALTKMVKYLGGFPPFKDNDYREPVEEHEQHGVE